MMQSRCIASAKAVISNDISPYFIRKLNACRSSFFQRRELKEGRKGLIQRNAILAFNLGGNVVGFKKANSATAFNAEHHRPELLDYLYLLAAGVVVLSQAFFVNKF